MTKQTLPQFMQDIADEICDHYCRWPIAYSMDFDDPDIAHEIMLDEKCAKCPVCRLT